MIRSLWIAKTGMEAQQTALDVISNNLANSGTNGYKSGRAVFEDLIYQNLRQVGANSGEQTTLPTGLQIGLGVRPVALARNFSQGALQQTGNSFDLAVRGNGFFQIQMPDGSTAYTRDGAFQLNAQGQMVTNSGYLVQPGITIPASAQSVTIGNDGVVTVALPAWRKSVRRDRFVGHTGSRCTWCQRIGSGRTGIGRNEQRQCGGRTGVDDPDPARLRAQLQGCDHLRPDAAEAGATVIRP